MWALLLLSKYRFIALVNETRLHFPVYASIMLRQIILKPAGLAAIFLLNGFCFQTFTPVFSRQPLLKTTQNSFCLHFQNCALDSNFPPFYILNEVGGCQKSYFVNLYFSDIYWLIDLISLKQFSFHHTWQLIFFEIRIHFWASDNISKECYNWHKPWCEFAFVILSFINVEIFFVCS